MVRTATTLTSVINATIKPTVVGAICCTHNHIVVEGRATPGSLIREVVVIPVVISAGHESGTTGDDASNGAASTTPVIRTSGLRAADCPGW